jgi:hypothetical protein
MRIILIAAVASLALAGCGQKVERQGDKTVVTGMGGVKSVVTTGAEAQAAAAALPAYAPVYPGASVMASTQSTVGGTTASAVTLTTTDTPEQVVAFYKARLTAGGLGAVSEMNLGLGRMVLAQDTTTGKGVQVMAMKAQGRTQIQITQSSAPPKG